MQELHRQPLDNANIRKLIIGDPLKENSLVWQVGNKYPIPETGKEKKDWQWFVISQIRRDENYYYLTGHVQYQCFIVKRSGEKEIMELSEELKAHKRTGVNKKEETLWKYCEQQPVIIENFV